MSLRLKRWFLRACTLLLVATAGFVVIDGLSASPDVGLHRPRKTGHESESNPSLDEKGSLDFANLWDRQLQQVLFDPPPPPVKEEVKPPPKPLNVKLLGTMIDESNSQAIIQDSSQNVLFRKAGESVTPERSKAIIETILPESIQVREEEHLTTLNME